MLYNRASKLTNAHLKIFLTIASLLCVYSLELSVNEATLYFSLPHESPAEATMQPDKMPISCQPSQQSHAYSASPRPVDMYTDIIPPAQASSCQSIANNDVMSYRRAVARVFFFT